MNKNLEPHQERVVVERADLHSRTVRLSAFVNQSSVFEALPEIDRLLLTRQLKLMQELCEVLAERIERFPRN